MLRPGKDKGIANPIPLGLAGLASTTFLMGVAIILQSPLGWTPYMVHAVMLGGGAEFIAGMWAFAYGDPMAATTFSFLGAFCGWWGVTHWALRGAGAALMTTSAPSIGLAFIVTGVVVLYLWVASFYEFAAFNLTLLFLWIAYGLIGLGISLGVPVLSMIGGISAIVSSIIGAYCSFAEVYNETSMAEVVPVGESSEVRDRVARDENERIRRVTANGLHQPSEAGV